MNTVTMSGLVRIRLNFQRYPEFPEIKNSWFLVDTSTCRTIADLEYLVKKRFGLLSNNTLINLLLDDYLLPSQEKIEIIQHNDNLRVEIEKVVTKKSREQVSNQGSEKKVKRKQRNTHECDARIKTKKRLTDKSPIHSTSSNVSANKTCETLQGNSFKSSEKEQNPSHVGKRKNTVELSKSNTKKSKTSGIVNFNDCCTMQNGLDSDPTSCESDSFTESTLKRPIKRKQSDKSLKTLLVEKKKATVRETGNIQCTGLNVDGSSSDSSNSTETMSKPNSKTKHKIGNGKLNAEKRKTTAKRTAKELVDSKDELNTDSSSSDSASSTETKSKPEPKTKHIIRNLKANAEKGKVTLSQTGQNHGKIGSDSSSSESSSSRVSSKCTSEKKLKSGNFKELSVKRKATKLGEKVKNADKNNKGARSVNGRTAKSSIVVLQGQNKGKDVLEGESSSSTIDSSEFEELANLALMESKSTSLSISSLSTSSTSTSSTSSSLPSSAPSIQKVNSKAGNIQSNKSQDEKRKDKNVLSLSTSLLPSAMPTSSSSSPLEPHRRYSCPTTDKVSKRHLSKDFNKTTSPLALSVTPTGQGSYEQKTPGQGGSGKLSSSFSASHIRFDSDEDDIEEQQNDDSMHKNTDSTGETRQNAVMADGQCEQIDQTISRKDVERKEPTQPDYTSCPPLHGPPRAGDKIAYKVLELSASYTPEISNYKKGSVISYEAKTGEVTVELTKDSLKRTQGDGNVSGKFELVYEEEEGEENQKMAENEQLETQVVVPWFSMLEPVLVED
ncbi:coilin-like [Montipora capricornis]|uniref:coilin-like n=1 Tax=Montipora capricornis TaxID=246305 RepID=UPI0035F19F34